VADPIVGWRVWNLRDGRLGSWAIDRCWKPGENVATCLPYSSRACRSSPGHGCQCGFWAVWSPMDCVVRACTAKEPPWHAMGLVAGWGTVALHGREGFRAERAALLCLFTDRPWAGSWRSRRAGRLVRPWRFLLRWTSPGEVEARYTAALDAVATHYGVPLVSLREAVRIGLLDELGVPSRQIDEAARVAGRAVASP
jgi:hypothetical protein